jgi:F-type H+-transporting ATPase subunit b
MAEVKIAQAEAQAAADVRSAAADAAVAAAERILAQQTKGPLAGDLIAKGIEDVRKKLNWPATITPAASPSASSWQSACA